MAIENFIPTIWSENLYTELDKQYIAVKNCNREYVTADKKGNRKAYREALKENELIDIAKMVMTKIL